MAQGSDLIDSLNNAKMSSFHFKTWFISGMGFFTDAYDLFIIGMVIAILKGPWNLSTSQIGILGSTTLIASVIGALVFGRLLDKYGRKRIYGIEIMILIIGAIFSAFSQNFDQLLLWRFVLGIGIGGDYSASSIIMSEYSNKQDRGKLVGMVFSMQSIGLLVGPLITMLLLTLNVPLDLAWRLLLAIGSIPPLLVVYYRRKMDESPRYLLKVKGDIEKARLATSHVTNVGTIEDNVIKKVNVTPKIFVTNKKYFLLILATSLTWFLMDWAFYGNSISSSIIFKEISPNITLYQTALYTFIIFLIFAFPGYWLATAYLDKIGRYPIQLTGFAVMGIAYFLIGLYHAIMGNLYYFILLYGISYFFIEFGPNVTTFVYPAEVFPVSVRGTGDGISAAAGKMGAFIGTLAFPFLVYWYHLDGVFIILGIISLLGLIVSAVLLPEPKNRSLEEVSGETELETIVTKFSPVLMNHMGYVIEADNKLKDLFNNPSSESVDQIKKLEHEADVVVHNIHNDLIKTTISSTTRTDMVYLTSSIDDIIDGIESISARMRIFNFPKANQNIFDLLDVIHQSNYQIMNGLKHFDDLLLGDSKEIEKVCIIVNTLENKGDEILRKALKELFDNEKDPIKIIIYKEIYEKLEMVTDSCEDVTDVFREMITRYKKN